MQIVIKSMSNCNFMYKYILVTVGWERFSLTSICNCIVLSTHRERYIYIKKSGGNGDDRSLIRRKKSTIIQYTLPGYPMHTLPVFTASMNDVRIGLGFWNSPLVIPRSRISALSTWGMHAYSHLWPPWLST